VTTRAGDSHEHARTAVIALGGNALAPAGEAATIYDQFRHTRESLAPIVELARSGWSVCVVHGNGPQVGDELVRNEVAREEASPLPLGVLVAATAGWIGYMIQQSLDNALSRRATKGAVGAERGVATIITQVEVDASDPALRNPTKFIGRALSAERAKELEADGHVVRRDGNGNLRRVVGSPEPKGICEIGAIRTLVDSGMLVVACGGGGAPVYRHPTLGWEGMDAVVDKDLAAAVLARDLDAALLLILTDVDAVYAGWGTPHQRPLRQLSIAEAERMDAARAFGEGSMAPKIRAAVDFVRRTGGRAIITSLARGQAAVRGEAGTTITVESA
jgi:carbamate kinase